MGENLDQLAVAPDVDSLRRLARRIEEVHCEPVCAVIESMAGARFVHDSSSGRLGRGDRRRGEGEGSRAAGRQDRQDDWKVLAELSRHDLVPAIWLPDPASARSVSAPDSGCTSSSTSRRSRTEFTRR